MTLVSTLGLNSIAVTVFFSLISQQIAQCTKMFYWQLTSREEVSVKDGEGREILKQICMMDIDEFAINVFHTILSEMVFRSNTVSFFFSERLFCFISILNQEIVPSPKFQHDSFNRLFPVSGTDANNGLASRKLLHAGVTQFHA